MEYGIILNGQMLVHRHQHNGDKPIIRTTPPQIGEDELLAVYYEENDSKITEKWIVSKNEYEPIIDDVATATDYEAALNRVGVEV